MEAEYQASARVALVMRTRAERRHARQRKVAKALRCIRQEHSYPTGETDAQRRVRASKWADNMDVHGAHCLCKMEKHQQRPTASLRRRVDSVESSRHPEVWRRPWEAVCDSDG